MLWPTPWMQALPWLRALLLVLPAVALCAAPARSEVSVEGTAAALRVKAEQAPLSEVLVALETRLGVRHSALIALDGATVGGTYSGTLEDVLRRLLAGFNYIIRTEGTAVEIVIVSRPGAAPEPFANRPPPVNINPAAPRRIPGQQP